MDSFEIGDGWEEEGEERGCLRIVKDVWRGWVGVSRRDRQRRGRSSFRSGIVLWLIILDYCIIKPTIIHTHHT